MSDILLDVQGQPTTPGSGQGLIFVDTLTKKMQHKNDAGSVDTVGDIENFSTADQTGFAADTYLAGSSILIPTSLIRAGTMYECEFDMTKTGAGTATPIITLRFGTAGAVGDTARLTFTFAVGTAVIDSGKFRVRAHFRVGGASATMRGEGECNHHLAATGLTSTGASGYGIILASAAAFDATVASSIIGLSFNGGTSFAGTNVSVRSKLFNV